MSHVFISYSKKNHNYARKLADKLLELGFDVWIDDRIDYGEEWWELIVKSIQDCSAFVVLMTSQSRASKWVRREILLADSRNIPIFPLLLEGENWELFIDKQFIDVRGGNPPPKSFYLRLAGSAPHKNHRGKEILAELPASEPTPEAAALPVNLLPPPPDVTHIMPVPFDWCYVSEGKVLLAEVDDWRGHADGGESSVAAFYMAKYPITNAQFHIFVDALDGYMNPQWWEFSSAAKAWHAEHPQPSYPSFDFKSPHPRVNVSWYESMAFCQWLNAQLKQDAYRIILPTETQWQRAAVGDTGFIYPWGDEFDPQKCNTRESGIRQLTPVTQYPAGASPFGVMDMSGNVCEWCLTEWGSGEDRLGGSAARCLRGGSWSNAAIDAQAAFRDTVTPDSRFNYRGFRIAAVMK